MDYVQLGFISECVDYVIDHIISPAFNKIMEIVSYVHKIVFGKVLEPMLARVFGLQVELFKTIIINILSQWLYKLEVTVLKVLGALEKAFRTFAGLEPVYVNGEKKGSLLLALTQSNYVMRALLILSFVGIVLCFLFAVLATVKSMADLEGQKPIGKVMRATAKSLLTLIMVPIISLFFVVLGDTVLKQVDIATKTGEGTLADAIFVMSTLDAVREDDFNGYIGFKDAKVYNSSTRAAALKTAGAGTASDYGLNDKYRKPYYDQGVEAWGSLTTVLKVFDIRRIDYVVGIGGGLLYIYMIGASALVVIARVFDMLTLILVSPFFASTMPLDEGERYKKWTDTFLGKMVSGYGLIVGMNVYLGIVELIISGKVKFFGEGTTEAIDYLVRLLFMAVGAYAITQTGPIVTSIMNVQMARREAMAIAYGSSIMATPVTTVGGWIGKGLSNVLGRAWNNITGKGNLKGGAGAPGMTEALNQNTPNAFGQPQYNMAYAGPGNAFNGSRPVGMNGGYGVNVVPDMNGVPGYGPSVVVTPGGVNTQGTVPGWMPGSGYAVHGAGGYANMTGGYGTAPGTGYAGNGMADLIGAGLNNAGAAYNVSGSNSFGANNGGYTGAGIGAPGDAYSNSGGIYADGALDNNMTISEAYATQQHNSMVDMLGADARIEGTEKPEFFEEIKNSEALDDLTKKPDILNDITNPKDIV